MITADPATLRHDAAHDRGSRVYPGSLRLDSTIDDLHIQHELWFDSSHTALVRVRVSNNGETRIELDAAWIGSVFAGASLETANGGVKATSPSGTVVRVLTNRPTRPVEIDGGARYRLSYRNPFTIPPGGEASFAIALTMVLPDDPSPTADAIRAALADIDKSWRVNLERWNGYLDKIDTGRPPQPGSGMAGFAFPRRLVEVPLGPTARVGAHRVRTRGLSG